MSKFNKGDEVIPQESQWHYPHSKDNGRRESIESIVSHLLLMLNLKKLLIP